MKYLTKAVIAVAALSVVPWAAQAAPMTIKFSHVVADSTPKGPSGR